MKIKDIVFVTNVFHYLNLITARLVKNAGLSYLVKQIYVLKAGHPDNKNNALTWDYYHTINSNDKYAVNYSANKNKKSDD